MFLQRDVRVEQVGDVLWRLLAPIVWHGPAGDYVVPAGYVTDFASVPRVMWWFAPQSGRWNAAAIIHDWLITDLLPTGAIRSAEVDKTFRSALAELGVPFAKRWLMWAGVRWGALGNRLRRSGSLCTLPQVLLVSLLALPVVLPGGLGVLVSSALLWLVSRVI
jgi:hypothetical protein